MKRPVSYLIVFTSLLGFTALTVGISFLDLGPFNVFVSLSIAFGKALLVALYFMHLRTSQRLVWLFAGAGLYWIGIMFLLTFSDVLTRQWVPVPGR
jgi:cytochrome c oxidase subunit 4